MNRILGAREIARDPAVSKLLARFTGKWARTGMIFDFDGVLSPIQHDPDASMPAPGVLGALSELTALVPQVSIVSSRPADFLVDRFGLMSELSIFASYGLERVEAGRIELDSSVPDDWKYRIQEARNRAKHEFAAPGYAGVRVENKGIALGIHFREVTTKSVIDDIEQWASRESGRIGGILKSGREVIEIACPSDVDKGTTVAAQLAELSAACYFGDDLGDLPAFAALRDREKSPPEFRGVAVAVANDAPVKPVMDAADLRIDDPYCVVTLLKIMISEARKVQ